jgi:membrane-bound lytic murein transglycosylase B
MSGDDRATDFDDLVRGLAADVDHALDPPAESAAGRGWIVVSISAGLAGLAVLGLAVLSIGTDASEVAAVPSSTPTAIATVVPTPSAEAPAPRPRGIADLADPAWVASVADRSGIPARALTAYAGAALKVATEDPECGLGWNTLAAIGSVESEHGTVHGGEVSPGGVARPTILGIALDGTTTDAIRDSDDGALDGDAVWDRAVGPMQFIPETWALFASDANGDGTADINNIDDAALTAGRYLCASGGDVSVPSDWIAAISSYNSAIEYNNKVAAAATFYGSLR